MTEPSLQGLEADRAPTVPAAVEVERVRVEIRAGTTRQARNLDAGDEYLVAGTGQARQGTGPGL